MPSHFGNVTAEYRALRSGRGFVVGHSELLWISGSDAIGYLDGQLSQDIAALPVGTTARTFLLQPKGKLAALAWVWRGEAEIAILVDFGRGERVRNRLDEFRFRVDAEIHLVSDDVVEVWGPGSSDVATQIGVDLESAWSSESAVTAVVLNGESLARLVVVGINQSRFVDAGLVRAGTVATNSVRVEAGEPVMGVDVDESTIPQETGLTSAAVSFTKGCYVGQELVARIDSRGRANRRLAGIEVATNVVPPIGAEVVWSGELVGSLTTVGESLALMAPVALAMVRREVADDADVEIRWESGSAPGTVRSLPLDDLSDISHSSYTIIR